MFSLDTKDTINLKGKLYYIKIKNIFSSKDTITRMKTQPRSGRRLCSTSIWKQQQYTNNNNKKLLTKVKFKKVKVRKPSNIVVKGLKDPFCHAGYLNAW